ncbi:MAG: HisA/HisF-related TIM barrel protein [Steroidobacteraceae bacterium]
MQLIPAIDLRGGQVVRLLRGNFGEETRYAVDPLGLVERYRELGCTLMHLVDLDGARGGEPGNRESIRALLSRPAPGLQVGGGIRERSDVEAWLAMGVDRVVVGSTAVERPQEVATWIREFGAERVVLALDVTLQESGQPRLRTRGWEVESPTGLWDLLDQYSGSGLRHVLCTDIARDGTLEGPSVGLYREALARHPELAWQASGGVRGRADLEELRKMGVAAAISGRALLDGTLTEEEILPFLRHE